MANSNRSRDMTNSNRPSERFDIKKLIPNFDQFSKPRHDQALVPIDPNNPILTLQQRRLLTALEDGQYWGLAREIWCIAKSKSVSELSEAEKPHLSTYKKLAADEVGAGYVFQLLCCHPKKVLRHLICNDLFSAVHEDDDLREYVATNMQVTGCPACYIVGICRVKRDGVPFPGRYLSANEIDQLCDFSESYGEAGTLTTPEADADAAEFDRILPIDEKQRPKDPKWRRYCQSEQGRVRSGYWRQRQREIFTRGETSLTTNIPDEKRDVPFRRTPCYVGITKWLHLRMVQHMYNISTSYILGLANAWTQARTPSDYRHRSIYQEVSYPVFRLWISEPEFHQVAESTATLLTSAFLNYGGFSIGAAGTSMPKETEAAMYDVNEGLLFPQTAPGDLSSVIDRMNSEVVRVFNLLDSPFVRLERCQEELAVKEKGLQDLQTTRIQAQFQRDIKKNRVAMKAKESENATTPWKSALRQKWDLSPKFDFTESPHAHIEEPLPTRAQAVVDEALAAEPLTDSWFEEMAEKGAQVGFELMKKKRTTMHDEAVESTGSEMPLPTYMDALESMVSSCQDLMDTMAKHLARMKK